jgi:hypothetical protein
MIMYFSSGIAFVDAVHTLSLPGKTPCFVEQKTGAKKELIRFISMACRATREAVLRL